MYEYVCNDCKQMQRWEQENSVGGMIPKHCASCGSADIVHYKMDSYWYDLAVHCGLERGKDAADLVLAIYKLWEPATCPRFVDFFNATMEEMKTTV